MIIIRYYRPGDDFAVRKLERRAVQEIGAWRGDGPWDDELRDIEASFSGDRGCFLVATDSETGRLVGIGAWRRAGRGTAEITRMRVARDRQGQGVGQELLEALEQTASGSGIGRLVLHTSSIQKAAQRFYEAAGYSLIKLSRIGRFRVLAMGKTL